MKFDNIPRFVFYLPMIAILALTACADPVSSEHSNEEPAAPKPVFDTVCIDGVSYVTRWIGWKSGVMAVKLGTDSKIIPCSIYKGVN